MNITEFLEARITEDEVEAREFQHYEDDVWETAGWWNPTRVLAECAAKRALLESYENVAKAAAGKQPNVETALTIEGMREGTRMALVALTFPYKDHQDWQADWAKYAE